MFTSLKNPYLIFISSLLCLLISATGVKAQVDDIEPSRGLYYYSGYIGDADKIEFNLQFNGLLVSGSYIIESTGDMFVFNGRMGIDRKGIGVLVYNSNNIFIASIEASFVSSENNFGKMLNGNWKSADGKKQQSLKLKKVAEFAQGPVIAPLFEVYQGD